MDLISSRVKYDMATKNYKLSEIVKFSKKSHRKAGDGLSEGKYQFFTSSKIQSKWLDEADYKEESIILGTGGLPSIHISKNFSTSADTFVLTSTNPAISMRYIYFFLAGNIALLEKGFKGAGLKHLSKQHTEKIIIPIPVTKNDEPDFTEQNRIVLVLEEAQNIKNKRLEANQKIDKLLPSLFAKMFGDISEKKSNHPWGTIRQSVRAESGKSSKEVLSSVKTEFPIYGGNGITGWAKCFLYTDPVLIVGRVGQQCGSIHLSQGPCWVTDNAIVVTIKDVDKLNPIYLADALRKSSLGRTVESLDLPYINQSIILDANIPLPKIELQNQYANLVKEIELNKENQNESTKKVDELFNAVMAKSFA